MFYVPGFNLRWPHTVYLFILRFQFLQKIYTFSFVYEHKAWACQPLGGSFYLVAATYGTIKNILVWMSLFLSTIHKWTVKDFYLYLTKWTWFFFKGKNLETCCLFKPMLFSCFIYRDPTSPFSVVNMYKVNSKSNTEAPLWTLESIKTLHLLYRYTLWHRCSRHWTPTFLPWWFF